MIKNIIKTFLSLWIIYHVFVIFVMPNSGSFLGRYFGSYLVSYANFFGLNSPWIFFSPNPPPEYKMKITLYQKDSDSVSKDQQPIEIDWPLKAQSIPISTTAIRNLYLMHFFIRAPNLIEQWLAPWFCKENNNIEFVNILIKYRTPPALDKARILTLDELNQSYEEVLYFEKSFSCP